MNAKINHHLIHKTVKSVLASRLSTFTYSPKSWAFKNTFMFWTNHQRPRGVTS